MLLKCCQKIIYSFNSHLPSAYDTPSTIAGTAQGTKQWMKRFLFSGNLHSGIIDNNKQIFNISGGNKYYKEK